LSSSLFASSASTRPYPYSISPRLQARIEAAERAEARIAILVWMIVVVDFLLGASRIALALRHHRYVNPQQRLHDEEYRDAGQEQRLQDGEEI
jgi:hypothetical protein